MTGISLICGLGNPGDKYAQTRHNAGFWFLGALSDAYGAKLANNSRFESFSGEFRFEGSLVRVLAPQTFMNKSGAAIAPFSRFYSIPPEEILVVHDEIDLPPGVVRLKQGGGHGGHNGLRDIITHLGSKDFYRLRVGVGRPEHSSEVISYVLKRPNRADSQLIEGTLAQASAVLPDILRGDMSRAMNVLHTD